MYDAEMLRIGIEAAIVAQFSLFALYLLTTADKRRPAGFFLAALCSAVAATVLINALVSAGLAPRLRIANYFIDLGTAPLLLGFVARAGEQAPALHRSDWLHLAVLFGGGLALVSHWNPGPDVFVLIVHLGYLAVACRIGAVRRQALRDGRLADLTAVLLGAFALVWLLRVWVVLDSRGLVSYRVSPAYPMILVVILALASFMLWAAMRRPNLLAHTSAPAGKGRSPGDAALLEQRLLALIDGQHLYLEPNLTLADVAARLRVAPRQVSQTATRLAGNFSTLLNNRRAELVARALEQPEAGPITTIMFDSGFGSKSAFQREFRRRFGVSPTEYRRRVLDRSKTAAS
jgi:AraC-like DNA-binding protein